MTRDHLNESHLHHLRTNSMEILTATECSLFSLTMFKMIEKVHGKIQNNEV
uniref:Uncharacterized protein n=1 Tax=Arion vulgaris TaxID=1028688 RepID=A0A0B7ARL9_9EUPU